MSGFQWELLQLPHYSAVGNRATVFVSCACTLDATITATSLYSSLLCQMRLNKLLIIIMMNEISSENMLSKINAMTQAH